MRTLLDPTDFQLDAKNRRLEGSVKCVLVAAALVLAGCSLVVVDPNKTITVPFTGSNVTIALPGVGVPVKQPASAIRSEVTAQSYQILSEYLGGGIYHLSLAPKPSSGTSVVWEAAAGRLSGTTSNSVQWKAPAEPDYYGVSATIVADGAAPLEVRGQVRVEDMQATNVSS